MQSLQHYSLIGNCRGAALVSKQGAIDWCCLPEFHSPAIFSALLDQQRGGRFSIAPEESYHSGQRYIHDTNVLETIFTSQSGSVVLTDAFVALPEERKKGLLFPDHEIIRMVRCTQGSMRMNIEYSPGVYYGSRTAKLKKEGKNGIHFCNRDNLFVLISSLAAEQLKIEEGKAFASFGLQAGESMLFSLSSSSQGPAIIPEIRLTGESRLNETIAYWKQWSSGCKYKGAYSEWVKRSALALKLLAHAPSGAIIAAPTTSLPEVQGGARNWDYRYCWLRDASFTIRVLLKLGFMEEVQAYMNWILHATRLTHPALKVVYSVYGESRLSEDHLHWLSGFNQSRPVRIGNGASSQHQLDVYGEVMDAYYAYAKSTKSFDRSTRKFIRGLAKQICAVWDQPDHGIWEIRSEKKHHTHSKVMAWVGLDRYIKLVHMFGWKENRLKEMEGIRFVIQEQIEKLGFNEGLSSYIMSFGERQLDASALVFPLVEYCNAESPRMLSTVSAIRNHLSSNNFIYRYRNQHDGLQGNEGCFGICNFWLVENLARVGNVKDARVYFEAMLERAGPTGLFSEEIDPGSFELLGNFPQGFTHIGLINAAFALNEAVEKEGAKT